MKKQLCTAILLLIGYTGNTQTISKTEQQIVKIIDADMPATIALLKASVDINSGTFNKEGVKKVGALFTKELATLDPPELENALPYPCKNEVAIIDPNRCI